MDSLLCIAAPVAAIEGGTEDDLSCAKTIAILQSNYIPWIGYFDIIASVGEFLIFDDAQFTRRDWRNRNKIIINGKPHWLTIPVASKGRFKCAIDEIEICDLGWAERHWQSIRLAYGKAAYFSLYGPIFEAAYSQAATLTRLTDINELFLRRIAGALELQTRFLRTEGVSRGTPTPTGRLLEICKARGATRYVSGPAARDYIEAEQFAAAGVELRYADYSNYRIYDQKVLTFEHGVSMVDVLMRCGPESRSHLKSIQLTDGLLAPR